MELNKELQEFAFYRKGLIGDIRDSIRNRFYMNIDYTNKYVPFSFTGYRNIAPAALGVNRKSGSLVLRAYLVRGVSYVTRYEPQRNNTPWRLFLINRITNWGVSNNTFGPLPLYRLNDRGLIDIREQLLFSSELVEFSANYDDFDWYDL